MKFTATTMGMPLTIQLPGCRDSALCERVLGRFDALDAIFSTYKPTSEISRLNAGMLSRDQCADTTNEILARCDELSSLTMGYFSADGPAGLDPSGYVKGYAIAEAARLIEAHNVKRYLIELAGDLQAMGPGPRTSDWRIGIVNPFDTSTLVAKIGVQAGAVATSGTYERGQHIYNPLTGTSAREALSLTVVGDSIDRVDAFATAAFAMGEAGLAWLSLQGYEGLMIFPDRTQAATAGFSDYLIPD